jgi:hypothetical protein
MWHRWGCGRDLRPTAGRELRACGADARCGGGWGVRGASRQGETRKRTLRHREAARVLGPVAPRPRYAGLVAHAPRTPHPAKR